MQASGPISSSMHRSSHQLQPALGIQRRLRVWQAAPPRPSNVMFIVCGRQPGATHSSQSPAPSSQHQVHQSKQPKLIKPSLWGKAPSTKAGATNTATDLVRRKQSSKPEPPGDDEDEFGWGWFDGSRSAHRWETPWGWGTTLGGISLWFLSFIVVGIIAVPGTYKLAGVDPNSLPASSKAVFTLACQAVETVVGMAVIRLVTAKALQKNDLPEEKSEQLFNYSLEAPFRAPYGWAAWAIVGVLLSPIVVGVTASLISYIGYDDNVGGAGTVDGVAGMIEVDLSSYLSLLMVTGVLAPILEETVFRGFLLPSLSKHMPSWAAVSISSLAFGAAHLSPRDLPVLVALGGLLGFSYIRSRNLLTPIIIHGVWNSTVLTLLFGLAASGVDVETALRELR